MHSRGFGRYEVRQEIGRGGMARVYLANDPTFRRQVAIKVLPPHYLENPLLRARFEREARMIATIEHPAIVPVYDFGEQDGQLYLVMRYMPGGSLAALIRQGPVPLARASELLTLLAPALDAVHDRGIIHRDLKPANILLDAFGNPALSDFGIAHLSEATVELTGEAIIGTPAYMSPEQVRGDADMDGRSDIYSLGIILFEMLSGQQPFQASTPMSAAMRHLTDPVPQIHRLQPDLPEPLQAVLDRAMAKDRDERYKLATDLAFDLRTLSEAYPSKNVSNSRAGNPKASESLPAAGAATQMDAQPEIVEATTSGMRPAAGQTEIEPVSALPASPASVQPTSVSTPRTFSEVAADRPPRRKSLARISWLAIIPAACLLVTLVYLGAHTLLPAFVLPTQTAALSMVSLTPPPNASQTPRPSLAPSQTPQPSVAPTEEPSATHPVDTAATPTSPPAPQPVPILVDDFSTPENGWPQANQAGGGYSYQDGEYLISALKNGSLYWAAPDKSYSDLQLSVEAKRVSGDQGYYGVLCRIQDADNYYYFLIRPDGYFTIGKYEAGSFVPLTSGGWTFDQAIQTSDGINQIEAACSGDDLRLNVNGVLIGEARDSTFTSGKPGLVVAALDDGGFHAGFDNFAVSIPAP